MKHACGGRAIFQVFSAAGLHPALLHLHSKQYIYFMEWLILSSTPKIIPQCRFRDKALKSDSIFQAAAVWQNHDSAQAKQNRECQITSKKPQWFFSYLPIKRLLLCSGPAAKSVRDKQSFTAGTLQPATFHLLQTDIKAEEDPWLRVAGKKPLVYRPFVTQSQPTQYPVTQLEGAIGKPREIWQKIEHFQEKTKDVSDSNLRRTLPIGNSLRKWKWNLGF